MTVAESFGIMPGRLRQSGSGMAGLGDQLGGRLSSIRAEQAGSASVWGGDDAGTAFGGAYGEVAQTAGEALAALADALDTVGAKPGGDGGHRQSG
ncbi:MAG: hypothetical protein ACRDT0_24215 [Pseudonocardiaceae bacterium]